MSDELAVLVPSRSRPTSAEELIASWHETRTTAHLWLVTDDDDPTARSYPADSFRLCMPERLWLGPTLNKVGEYMRQHYQFLGFMGDDHRPRTTAWDTFVVEALRRQQSLRGHGMVYCNDLFQGARLPTAIFMTSSIVETLGYMVPPGQRHLYLDDFWLRLGRELDCLAYLDSVVVEHMHPAAGKAANDAGYNEVNSPEMYRTDKQVFDAYCATQLAEDVMRLRRTAR